MEENRARQAQVTTIMDKMEHLVMYRLNNGIILHGMLQSDLDDFENTLNGLQYGLDYPKSKE